jgi:threonine synthase
MSVITYTDTRGRIDRPRTFTEVILEGIAPGGGLFVPQELPEMGAAELHMLAALVYEAFGLDVSAAHIHRICSTAYGANFAHPQVAPVRDLGDGRFVLELWHGPTLAFKDMALQCMPLFFSQALEQAHESGASQLDYLILVATSGDTGVAALNGFADRAHTSIVVYYPDAGVSAVQERQMITQPGDNLSVLRVEGDFDTCQTAVKAVFDDPAFAAELAERHRLSLSSANSINWGRLMPQIVYYLSACADMLAGGHLPQDGLVDVCVPTGNFGDILAGYYARRMGAPIGRLLCASNTNNVLADFIATGTYDIGTRSLVKTPSPSMDILVSSNLERLLYDLSADPERISDWMNDLCGSGRFVVDAETLRQLQTQFVGDWVDNAECLRTIGEVYRERDYLMDPHTAVGWRVADRLKGDAPVLIVSTAHWSKFAADVARALAGTGPDAPLPVGGDELDLLDLVVELAPGASVPPQLSAVRERPVRFRERVAGTREGLEESLRRWLSSRPSRTSA